MARDHLLVSDARHDEEDRSLDETKTKLLPVLRVIRKDKRTPIHVNKGMQIAR